MSSTYATMHVARTSRRDALLDWLQMLTGAGLVLFMWAHMILVASVVVGQETMNAIAGFFEATYMAQVGGPAIFAVFIVHFLLGARKIPFRARGQETIWKHSRMMRHADTWLWVIQAVTAMVVLVMGSIHMWVVLTDLPITAAKSAARIQGGFWLVFYLVLLPMVELHVSIGWYRIAVKWGVIKARTRPQAKRAEKILLLVFLVIGLAALVRFVTLPI
jgi:fumarate reductase subunit C